CIGLPLQARNRAQKTPQIYLGSAVNGSWSSPYLLEAGPPRRTQQGRISWSLIPRAKGAGFLAGPSWIQVRGPVASPGPSRLAVSGIAAYIKYHGPARDRPDHAIQGNLGE